MSEVYRGALIRAAQVLGGKKALREHLDVHMRELEAWLSGTKLPPLEIFLRAVDVISAPSARDGRPPSNAVRRARELRQRSVVLLERAARLRASALAGLESLAAPHPRSVLEFLQTSYRPDQGKNMVEAALETTLAATGAPMGNIQILCPEGLRIVAHRGFDKPFLDYFAICDGEGSCDAAKNKGVRIVVPDVAKSPIFAGTPAAKVMEEAGARAVQSTPLMASSGWVLGMLNTHYEAPHRPGERELEIIDRVAARTAYWLEGGPA